MDAIRRNRVAEIMAMGDDPAGEIALFLEFGAEVGSVVRASVRSQGGMARLDEDDIDNLIYDVCSELFRIRRSWRADGGALPWKWARPRIDAVVRDRIGPPRRRLFPADLDELIEEAPVAAPDDHGDGGAVSTLRRLSARGGKVELVHRLIGTLDGRAAEMLLRYQIQQDAGDPSPSHTVGAEFGLRPPAVRQVVSRARRKLSAVVAGEPTFAPLRSSPLVCSVSIRGGDSIGEAAA